MVAEKVDQWVERMVVMMAATMVAWKDLRMVAQLAARMVEW